MPDRMREHIHDKMLTWRPSGPHTVGPQARARRPATGPYKPAGPRGPRASLGLSGDLCPWGGWPIFGVRLTHLGARLAQLAAMLAPLGPAWGTVLLACIRAMLAHLRAMLAHLGAMWAQLAGHVGPYGGYVVPVCALFGAYVGQCWPILIHKIEKMGKPQNTVNCGVFVRSAVGVAAPFSYREEGTALQQCHGQGALAGFKGLRPTAGQGPTWGQRIINRFWRRSEGKGSQIYYK